MNLAQQKRAAKEFVERWRGRGDEKQDCQSFWTDFLEHVLDVPYASSAIQFERKIDLGKDARTGRSHTGFIDGYIPATKVLIEQKGAKIDLKKPAAQSDGTELTPYQQAKRYADRMTNDMRPRWIVVSNFQEIHVYDLNENLDTPKIEMTLADIAVEPHRLAFLADKEKTAADHQLQVSLKAGEIVGRLYDVLEKQYVQPMTPEAYQSLNKLCVRLVFCLYAEDSGLFETKSQFHDYLVSQGKVGVNRINAALKNLFRILNTKKEDRDPYDEPDLLAFPYVNGGLFADDNILIPRFSEEALELLVKKASADFDWSEISPTIFGAVFESTLNAETRRQGGMHYTSIENIHKVIDPLFLDDLRAEFEALKKSVEDRTKITPKKRQEFQEFQQKLGRLTFLDPACGSGNFLTETYLSLRRLENDVLRQIYGGQQSLGDELSPICVHISQFYGIEINDFAAVVAKTALWIAESQMMQQTREIVSVTEDFLPLKSAGHIVEGNALRMDWNEVVPANKLSYIMGNPPFVGARFMNATQKKDLLDVFGSDWNNAGDIDYVGGWFKKAFDCMSVCETPVSTAFVATNSICQGVQVTNLWEPLIQNSVKINFAWRTFVWDSEASEKAHVHCVIVGFSLTNKLPKRIYISPSEAEETNHINAYLISANDCFIHSRNTPLANVPLIAMGNQPIDNGNYLFSPEEKEQFLQIEPNAAAFFRLWYGADEFINSRPRYCLWLGNCSAETLRKLPQCMKRVEAVQKYRSSSKRAATKKLADFPRNFQTENMPDRNYIVIPEVSSERRQYVPMGFMTPDVLCSNKLRLMPKASLFMFGILNSSVHMAWMRAVAGRLKSDYSYSIKIVYNNFIWPNATEEQKAAIEKTGQAILDARAKYPNSSLADLYDDLAMPIELRKAHQANDRAVMKAYGFMSSMTEPEIVAELFKLYQKKVDELAAAEAAEKAAKKPRRKKAATPAAEDASSSPAD